MTLPLKNQPFHSPFLDNDVSRVYLVELDGDVYSESGIAYWDSCGIFISMIYYECDIDIFYITITFYFLEVLKYET